MAPPLNHHHQAAPSGSGPDFIAKTTRRRHRHDKRSYAGSSNARCGRSGPGSSEFSSERNRGSSVDSHGRRSSDQHCTNNSSTVGRRRFTTPGQTSGHASTKGTSTSMLRQVPRPLAEVAATIDDGGHYAADLVIATPAAKALSLATAQSEPTTRV